MKPSEFSSVLRQIAAKIDNSKNPDRRLVAAELKRVLATLSGLSVELTGIHKGRDMEYTWKLGGQSGSVFIDPSRRDPAEMDPPVTDEDLNEEIVNAVMAHPSFQAAQSWVQQHGDLSGFAP